jgi:hypothetical protein
MAIFSSQIIVSCAIGCSLGMTGVFELLIPYTPQLALFLPVVVGASVAMHRYLRLK